MPRTSEYSFLYMALCLLSRPPHRIADTTLDLQQGFGYNSEFVSNKYIAKKYDENDLNEDPISTCGFGDLDHSGPLSGPDTIIQSAISITGVVGEVGSFLYKQAVMMHTSQNGQGVVTTTTYTPGERQCRTEISGWSSPASD